MMRMSTTLLAAVLAVASVALVSGLPMVAKGQPAGPKHTVCQNPDIKSRFTAKVAVLMVANAKHPKVSSTNYAALIQKHIEPRLDRYNHKYKLALTASIVQKTSGHVEKKQQKWFYYDIEFFVGKCGKYKQSLVTQLRTDLSTKASFIKRIRILDFPYKG